ncbi:PspA/IM30 family protein [Thermodesulfobacteriota bacterium]
MNGADAVRKFDRLENRIERMESEADLVNYGTKPSLMEELESLGVDEEIEAELNAIKTSQAPNENAR